MGISTLHEVPIATAGAAIYEYSDDLMEQGARLTRFKEPYHLFRAVGKGDAARILVPRNMAPVPGLDRRVDGKDVPFKNLFTPRDSEQGRLVKESSSLLLSGKSHVLQSPTGSGKTFMASAVIAKVGKKTLVIVTKEDIVKQWIDAFESVLGLSKDDIGLIQGDICRVDKPIVIAMVQSMSKEDRYPAHIFMDFGLVVWDEVHRIGADSFSQSACRVPAKLRLGVSATPERSDGKTEVIEAHIGKVLVSSDDMPMGFKVIKIRSPWVCPRVRKRMPSGDYDYVQLPHSGGKCGHVINMIVRHFERNRLIVNFIEQAYKAKRKILVQSDTKEHLEILFSMCSIPQPDMGYYIGGLSEDIRDLVKKKAVIFSTYAMTKEATNIPELDTLVMGTPKADVVQIVGRILRVCEGKKEPLVLDVVDDTSTVFQGYANKRFAWYKSKKAPVTIK